MEKDSRLVSPDEKFNEGCRESVLIGRQEQRRSDKGCCTLLSAIARELHGKLKKTALPIKDKMDAGLSARLFVYLDF